MKKLHYFLFTILIYSLSFAQSNKDFKQNYLSITNCNKQPNKKECFNNYIAATLTSAVKTEIKDYLQKNPKRTYVVNHASFVVGENGKPIKGSIKTTNSKNNAVGLKLKQAILDLPEIMVRRNEYNYPILTNYKIKIKNGVDENGEIVVLDFNNKSKTFSTKSNMVAPIYKGCKSKDNIELKKCLSKNVSKIVGQKFNKKKAIDGFNKKGTFYTFIFFTIDKKGKLDKLRAYGPSKSFQDEALASLKKVKRITPGTKNGEPIRVSFALPIKLKVN
ncbi:energy transducer TonB [Lacinutrix sp.]|uniref:energy transducer TonB n=1 Tax=Lacinutrix sp. TaxID=1937692 RepID=UPI0025BE1990|nr:energy transducer TonB [Lacinutrix sp.]